MLPARALAVLGSVLLSASLSACSGADAPPQVEAKAEPKPEPAKPEPAKPEPVKVEPLPALPPRGPLAAGPDRYELPRTYGACASSEIFCGVQILDLATKQVTTLITRDQAKTWAVRAGKKETPVTVTLVEVPADPRVVSKKLDLFPGAAAPATTPTMPTSGLDLFYDVAAVAGEKTYAIARKDAYEKIFLYEIDPTGEYRKVEPGGWPVLVYPHREGIAVYTSAKRDELALYDPAQAKVTARFPIDVADLDRECKKLATETEPDRLMVLHDPDRAYWQFECVAIGA